LDACSTFVVHGGKSHLDSLQLLTFLMSLCISLMQASVARRLIPLFDRVLVTKAMAETVRPARALLLGWTTLLMSAHVSLHSPDRSVKIPFAGTNLEHAHTPWLSATEAEAQPTSANTCRLAYPTLQSFPVLQTTASGIVLPAAAAKAPNEATVIAVGPGFRKECGTYIACSVEVGDLVLLPEYGGSKIELDKEVRASSFRSDHATPILLLLLLLSSHRPISPPPPPPPQ
jgi:co-chaperonin GroES (HSP10)